VNPREKLPQPAPELNRRVWLEDPQPRVDDGRWPVKRAVGETVEVTVDALADGQDALAVVLRWRPASASRWREVPMQHVGNDRWRAAFTIGSQEPHHYTAAAWIERFTTWRNALVKKHAAGQDVGLELQEGATLLHEHAARAPQPDRLWLEQEAAALTEDRPVDECVARATDDDLAAMARKYPDRSGETTLDREFLVDVNRPRAACGAWYEFFPRSALTATEEPVPGFRAAEDRLPEIAHMGFDVVYLPPIHPIGRTHRKGRNNTGKPESGDPGSPWAIGAAEGGHKSVHPELGSLEDFDHFLAATRQHGLELAIDLAYQCSPDHPYVAEHPQWFRHRPDGSIRHAENPPKKYEDIYPLDFENADWRELWRELLDVALFWCARGVRILRVDNPHTKPLRFWQWLIAEVKRRHPETIFLAEAFTRPKLMYALAKVGFDQSYTYFTWRNTERELKQYLRELTRPPVSEFFRPNFFTNTPDILPEYLQFGGRPAFQIRLVLAATLAASYGIYSGFELCENRALPGREEYLDAEKYERKRWDWDRPGNIRELITRVNTIRRDNPALYRNDRLMFHPVDNEQLIFYSKTTPDLDNIILVAVNLDPHHRHSGWVDLPLAELDIGPHDVYQMHDLIGEGRYLWQGAHNYVELDPQVMPAQIFRLRRRVRTERDFDYFM
jgi:starch synthase (maltosyl-transferring)